jgi:NAD(P)-dependent dehydrogenase (short-subunit alcohol dehydrogenase family)
MKVLVTGAASGFGKAVSNALRSRGETVRGIDLRADDDVIAADIRNPEQVIAAVQRLIDEMNGLDILINNAGIGEPVSAGAMPTERALATIDTNLFGAWRMTAAALPALLQSRGRVINVASALAFVNVPFSAAYSASKRGLASYSDVFRLEYGDRIHVTTVYPGYVKTPIHQKSEEIGVSLSDAVPQEPMRVVVKAILGTCYARKPRRDVPTSLPTAVGIFFARHFPRSTDRTVRRRMNHLVSKGKMEDPNEVLRRVAEETSARGV